MTYIILYFDVQYMLMKIKSSKFICIVNEYFGIL